MSTKFTWNFSRVKSLDHANYEFGVPWSRNTFWHDKGDSCVLSYSGERIVEVTSGNEVYFYIPKQMSQAVADRWAYFFESPGLRVEFKKLKRTNGDQRYTVTFIHLQRKPNSYDYEATPICTVEARDRIRMIHTNYQWTSFEASDRVQQTYVKDKKKYAEFNKHLKRLRAALIAQAKMSYFTDLLSPHTNLGMSSREYMRQQIYRWSGQESIKHYMWVGECADIMYKAALKWIKDQDRDSLVVVGLCAIYNHTSELSRRSGKETEDAVRRVKNAMAALQKLYLQRECVTIEVSNNSLRLTDESDDQDRELLPPARLREVQVPSEAQVC